MLNWGGKKSIYTGPGKTHAQKKPEKTLSLHTRLISEGLPLYGASLQRLGEVAIFSNAIFFFLTKDDKADKETGKHGPFKRTR